MDKIKNKSLFKEGFLDGVPIGLGYVPLGIALGISAMKTGMLYWIWQSLNLLLYSGSALAAVLNLINAGDLMVLSYIGTFFTVNCRYLLLALTISQKLDPKMNTIERIIVGFFNTDEIFAVAMQKEGKLKTSYMFGISIVPYVLMMASAGLGYFFANFMPNSLASAFGITLYAMFIALIVPPSKTSKPALFTVFVSAALNLFLETNSFIRKTIPSAGLLMMICAITTSVISAILFPVKIEEKAVPKVTKK